MKHKFGQSIFDWSQVQAIVDTPDYIDINWRDGGILVVRDRAFESAGQRRQFIEELQSHLSKGSEPAQEGHN